MTHNDTKVTKSNTKTQLMKGKKLGSTAAYANLFLSGYLLIILLSQLFIFDKFPEVLMSAGAHPTIAITLVISLVILELLAVAYLVRAPKTEKMIIPGAMVSVLALTLLSALEIFAIRSGATIIFGATIGVPGGAWSITLLLAMWVLMIWVLLRVYADKKDQAVDRDVNPRDSFSPLR